MFQLQSNTTKMYIQYNLKVATFKREAGIIIEPVVIEASVKKPSDTTSERSTDKSESVDEDKNRLNYCLMFPILERNI
ncbi:hypothetical protein F8M41_014560 [Gigaspora margarita]|uniref:Uncharacterized protein n=1 Tax=Gigaspora margarita TaxID=4874 RepID=A0A8H3ZXF9_GIGMA|nr:hypothetical protein F8M41_014560 [Gigaspora margarita]